LKLLNFGNRRGVVKNLNLFFAPNFVMGSLMFFIHSPKMERTLFVPSKLIVHKKFEMFEFGAIDGCSISKEIALLNLFCYCRQKHP